VAVAAELRVPPAAIDLQPFEARTDRRWFCATRSQSVGVDGTAPDPIRELAAGRPMDHPALRCAARTLHLEQRLRILANIFRLDLGILLRLAVLLWPGGGTRRGRHSVRDLTIGIRSVELPEELDRPQIVTRTGANTVHIAEFDRWSASLQDSVMQRIAENLAILLPGDRVAVYPWTPGTSVDREVIVEVTRSTGSSATSARCTHCGRSWRGGQRRRRSTASRR